MAKWVDTAVLDVALTEIARAGRMLAVAGQPAGYAAAVDGRLAEAALAPADFTLADSAGGRRVAVAAKNDVPVTEGGVADHVALVHDASSRLLYVTTCPPQELLAGGSVSFDSWFVEIGAPA